MLDTNEARSGSGTIAGRKSTTDKDMLTHDPPIKRTSSTRFDEEQRNVRVQAWIYAVKYEAGQDWHIIAGTDPSGAPITYFNSEVSGLPKTTRRHSMPCWRFARSWLKCSTTICRDQGDTQPTRIIPSR